MKPSMVLATKADGAIFHTGREKGAYDEDALDVLLVCSLDAVRNKASYPSTGDRRTRHVRLFPVCATRIPAQVGEF
jgi:hypothetical protein